MWTSSEAFCDEGIRRARQAGYQPTVFQGMRARHGTVAAIEKLVQNGKAQTGFKRLKSLGLLDWSIEAAVRTICIASAPFAGIGLVISGMPDPTGPNVTRQSPCPS